MNHVQDGDCHEKSSVGGDFSSDGERDEEVSEEDQQLSKVDEAEESGAEDEDEEVQLDFESMKEDSMDAVCRMWLQAVASTFVPKSGKQVCFAHAHGKCKFQQCKFSHDDKDIAEYREHLKGKKPDFTKSVATFKKSVPTYKVNAVPGRTTSSGVARPAIRNRGQSPGKRRYQGTSNADEQES